MPHLLVTNRNCRKKQRCVSLETKLAIDRYIDQIAIIPDERKFVSALILLVYPHVEASAKEKGIHYNSMAD